MRFTHLTILLLLAIPHVTFAKVKTRTVDYTAGATKLQGYFAHDTKVKKAPGVLVVHEWWGHNEHARKQARRLAEAGYVTFALDMYGKGKLAKHPKDAQAFMEEVTKQPAAVRERFQAALDWLKKQPQVDADRIGAIGYCFGGAVILDMARAGQPLKAIGTFHAGLSDPKEPAKAGVTKSAILFQTGAADPMVPAAAVDKLKAEMKAANVDLTVVAYPGAKHSFTNPDADKAGLDALAYSADADQKSWKALLEFFDAKLKK